MSTHITLDYFGVRGEGPTIKAAKADAGARIEAYLRAGPSVRAFQHPRISSVFILWRTIDGWVYAIVHAGDRHLGNTGGACHLQLCAEAEAILWVKKHLAQFTGDPAVAREILTPERSASHASAWEDWRLRQAFQCAYHAATGTDPERHEWACHHQRDFLDRIAA